MTREEAQRYIGGMVRIRPHDREQHWGKGRLLAITGDYGVIKLSHDMERRYHLDQLKPWKSAAFANRQPPQETPPAQEKIMAQQPIEPRPAVVRSALPPAIPVPQPAPTTDSGKTAAQDASECLREITEYEQLVKDAQAMLASARSRWPLIRERLEKEMSL